MNEKRAATESVLQLGLPDGDLSREGGRTSFRPPHTLSKAFEGPHAVDETIMTDDLYY